jgi:hypothetical protein
MKKLKNSCGSEGCRVRIILPYGVGVESIRSNVLPKGNDFTVVLRPNQVFIPKIAA